MLRLGGAVQSFRDRRGLTQVPPLTESDMVSTETADRRNMAERPKEAEGKEEELRHRWRVL